MTKHFRGKRFWVLLVVGLAISGGVALLVLAAQPGLRGESNTDNGVVGWTGASDKSGVYGHSQVGIGVTGRSDSMAGVVGWTEASDKSGVYGYSTDGGGVLGRSDNNNGVVGWTGNPDASGVFGHSERGVGATGMSDWNNGLLGVTRSRYPGHAGVFARHEGGGLAIFCEGDLFITGGIHGDIGPAGGSPFPRPAFDSGWVAIPGGGLVSNTITIQHNVGGNPDDYFVDVQFRNSGGIHHAGYGGDWVERGRCPNCHVTGAYWHSLTNQSIQVTRYEDDEAVEEARVRIWVYE